MAELTHFRPDIDDDTRGLLDAGLQRYEGIPLALELDVGELPHAGPARRRARCTSHEHAPASPYDGSDTLFLRQRTAGRRLGKVEHPVFR
jgi:hypothetical protein